MKKSINLLIILILYPLICESCEIKVLSKTIETQWIVQNYVFYYFANNDLNRELKYSDRDFNKFREKLQDKINLTVIKTENPADKKKILEKLNIQDHNIIFLLISPYNKIIWSADESEYEYKDLESIVTSPVRKKIAKELRKNDIVMLFGYNKEFDKKDGILSNIESSIKIAQELYKISISLINIRYDDKKEEILIKTLGLNYDEPSLSFIIGNGKVLSVLKGEITEDSVHDRLQFINRTCFCTLQPFWMHRKDLLLNRKGLSKKETKK